MHSKIGQVATELITIMGISLLVVLIFMSLSLSFLSEASIEKNEKLAYDSVRRLAIAADTVYAQGAGASVIVEIFLPPTIDFNPNKTYIGKPANVSSFILPKTINMRVGQSDIFASTQANLAGSFPTKSGSHKMYLFSKGGQVFIVPYIASISRPSVFVSMAKGEIRNESIVLEKKISSLAFASIYLPWVPSDISINVSPSSSELQVEPTQFLVSIAANNNAEGIYNLNMEIFVSSEIGNQSFTVPVTVEVR
ncbi:MAG: hypothetical protein QXN37_00810 [Candidatus Anstonellaceae archaeon]